jgi:hypothetical protein
MAQATYLEAIRHGIWRVMACGLLSVAGSTVYAQKLGEVDLTLEPPAVSQEHVLPDECEGVSGGFTHGDGFILPERDHPKLELKVNSLSTVRPDLGSVIEAEIALKNGGKTDINIPWARDPNTAHRPAGATHYEYESAWLWFRLKDESGKEKFLKSLSLPLFSSADQPQSTLKLRSGQWVNMRIKFKLVFQDDRDLVGFVRGPAEIRIEWRQGNYTWERKGCSVTTGYSSYDSFYEQQMDPVKIFIASKEGEAQQNTRSQE